ncbi:hypothetical protein B0H17DRAFT_1143977 [Mycena rosella]|uniref:Zn(2)-C6 fungal-type domain-containing protein n=1 Tax=Mycena rosella TaxID=1033263 RepID=A0AAD7CTV6_MYCRO|nr:hypothetical protein B0H17DRAFT_1143977 [Mycena rosella]
MSNLSTPPTSSKLFTKRRRAYVACTTCRKRKIRCVTVSDADYEPCTRCAQKGLKCEYATVSEYEEDSPTPSPDVHGPSRASGWGGSSHPGITPPSAGIAGYLNPGFAPSRSSNRSPAPRPGATAPYPQPGVVPSYPYRPNAMRSGGANSDAHFAHPQPPNAVPNLSGHSRASSLHRPGHGQPGPQFYNTGPAPYSPGPSGSHDRGSFYNLNSDYQYAPPLQSGNTAYQWPQAMPPTDAPNGVSANAFARLYFPGPLFKPL